VRSLVADPAGTVVLALGSRMPLAGAAQAVLAAACVRRRAPPRVPLPGIPHAVVALVVVAVAAIVAGTVVVYLVVVPRGVVAPMVAHAAAMESGKWAVPGGPGPPERRVISPLPEPVAIVAYPADVVVAIVRRAPMVGVRALHDAPVRGDVGDRVRVVVPVVVPALVQVGVAHKVVHAVDLVDEVLLRIEVVGVCVQVLLVTPGAVLIGAGVRPLVLVHGDRAVRLGRGGHGEHRREDAEGSDECSRVNGNSCHWVLATVVGWDHKLGADSVPALSAGAAFTAGLTTASAFHSKGIPSLRSDRS